MIATEAELYSTAEDLYIFANYPAIKQDADANFIPIGSKDFFRRRILNALEGYSREEPSLDDVIADEDLKSLEDALLIVSRLIA